MLSPKEILIPRPSTSDLFRESSTRSLRTNQDKKPEQQEQPSSLSQSWLDLNSLDGLDHSSLSNSIKRILEISKALTLPAVFADSSWKTDATNLASLSDWTNNRAPTLLEGLSEALDVLSSELASSPGSTNLVTESRSTDTEIVQRALLSAIVAATRFIPPIELSVLHLEVSDPNRIAIEQEVAASSKESADPNLGNNQDGFDPWMTRRNRRAAKAIMSHSVLSSPATDLSSSVTTPYNLARQLLSSHIKPLFVSHLSNSSKLNSETSRPLHRDPNLIKPVGSMGDHAPSAEDVVWKGGGLDGEGRRFLTKVQGSSSSSSSTEIIEDRNQALGCWNVLAWCITAISRAQVSDSSSTNANEEKPWEASFRLVLPPLLALMDDLSPHFRCIGASILGRCALRSFEDQDTATSFEELGSVPSILLIRSGVAPLVLDSLGSSLTYTNDERDGIGSRLLDSSLRASRSLILLTTFNPDDVIDQVPSFNPLEDDGGGEQTLQLHHLVVEGILKVWSYLPSIPPSFTTSERLYSHHQTLRITFHWLRILSKDLGIFSSRFSGLAIEFVASQLDLGFDDLEEELSSSGKCKKSDETFWKNLKEKIITSNDANLTLKQLLISMLSTNLSSSERKVEMDSSIPPSIDLWSEKIVTACARCWAQLEDVDDQISVSDRGHSSVQRQELRDGLKEVLVVLDETKSTKARESFARLRLLDAKVFEPLLPIVQ